MSLSIGIVGLPNVGKSTLFNALTKKSVPSENYPFCTIDPSVGIVPVPDVRLAKLTEMSKSEKTIPAVVEFTDIAGLVKGASSGEGLGNKFLSHIREVDAIAEVVRIFEDSNITHVHGKVDPLSDIEVINLELILADRETVAKRLGNVIKESRTGDKKLLKEKEILERLDKILDEGKLASQMEMGDEDKEIVKGLHLLSMKPILYVLNKKGDATIPADLQKFFDDTKAKYVVVDAGLEQELKDLNENEKQEFRLVVGSDDSGLDNLIVAGYEILNLITFLTTGEKETRAWTCKRNSTAPQAGRSIHTDFEEKFIRAEVVAYEKLVEAGSYPAAREKGWVRTEGKEYIVQDGDVIEFRV